MEIKSSEKANHDLACGEYQVQVKGGLRIRSEPDAESRRLGKLTHLTIVEITEIKGNWAHHSKGWSMISDGEKNGKVYLNQFVRTRNITVGI